MQITLVKQERKMGQKKKKKKSLHVRVCVYIYLPLDVCWLFLSS